MIQRFLDWRRQQGIMALRRLMRMVAVSESVCELGGKSPGAPHPAGGEDHMARVLWPTGERGPHWNPTQVERDTREIPLTRIFCMPPM